MLLSWRYELRFAGYFDLSPEYFNLQGREIFLSAL